MANKQRQQIDSGLGATGFRPVAGHADGFVQTPAGRKLSQLAGALANFAPSLQRFSDVTAKEEQQKAVQQAEADMRKWDEARKDNDGLKQAIKEGAIRPDQSPWYRWAATQYFGRKAATDYEATLAQRVESELGDSYDVEDFNALEAKTRKEFMDSFAGDQRNATFDEAFGREAEARVAGMRTSFAHAAGARLRKMTLDNLSAVVSEHIDGFISEVPDMEDSAAYGAVAAKIQTEMDRLVGVGENPLAVNNAVKAALVRLAAQEDTGIDVKKLADMIVTDKKSGAKLGRILDFERDLDAAQDDAIADKNRNEQIRVAAEQRQQREAFNTISTGYISGLAKTTDPFSMRPEVVTQQLIAAGVTDPNLLQAPTAFFRNAVEGRATTNPQLLNELFAGVMNGTTSLGDIRSAVSLTEGGISAHDGAFLWNAVQEQQDRALRASGGGSLTKALDSDVFRLYLTEFKGKWGNDMDMESTARNRREDSVGELVGSWLQFSAEHPDADPRRQLEWLRNRGQGIFVANAPADVVKDVDTDLGANTVYRRPQISRYQANNLRGAYERRQLGPEWFHFLSERGIPPQADAIKAFVEGQAGAYGIPVGAKPPEPPKPHTDATPAEKGDKSLLAPSPYGETVGERARNLHFTSQ